MRRHIPAEHHDGFVFSAKHLFNGDNKVFKRDDPDWPLERRLKIADEIASTATKFALPIALGWVERSRNIHNNELSNAAYRTRKVFPDAAHNRVHELLNDGGALDAAKCKKRSVHVGCRK